MVVRAVLLDLEGVLYEGDRPVEGAADAVARLRAAGVAVCFLTNTTTRPRHAIAERLRGLGFAVADDEVFTPALAAVGSLRARGLSRLHLAAPAALAVDFAGFTLVDEDAEAVVMGDLYTDFTWARLNAIFGLVRGGACLIALHKNRYCRRDGALALDLGPFVAAIEYAADVEAEVVGKPSPAFFALALAALGVDASQALMVGDDIEADIGGAQGAGIRAVQVETGKFSDRDLAHPRIRPEWRIPSVAALPRLLETLA